MEVLMEEKREHVLEKKNLLSMIIIGKYWYCQLSERNRNDTKTDLMFCFACWTEGYIEKTWETCKDL